MKRLLLTIPLLLYIACTSNDDYNANFDGLTIAELEGKWKIIERRSGYYPNDILVNLNECELSDKLIINNNGEAIHYIANSTNTPCDFEELNIIFKNQTAYDKKIDNVNSANSNVEYELCTVSISPIHGETLKIYYFIDGASSPIIDLFGRFNE